MKKANKLGPGFTLIEVLLALSIIAIALTALLKATAQNIVNTSRLKDKAISHWVALQGATMVQLGLITLTPGQESTEATQMFGQRWYWRISTLKTPLQSVSKISITVSKKQAGPFDSPLVAFRYERNETR